MKKILALILALVMVFALAACGDTPAETPAEEPTTEDETPASEPAEEGGELLIGCLQDITGATSSLGMSVEALAPELPWKRSTQRRY